VLRCFYWLLSILKFWIPCNTPKWVLKAMGNWERRMSNQPIHKGITVVNQYFKGKTFVYKITYEEESIGEITYSCCRILRRW
jgi:hypothetical protein